MILLSILLAFLPASSVLQHSKCRLLLRPFSPIPFQLDQPLMRSLYRTSLLATPSESSLDEELDEVKKKIEAVEFCIRKIKGNNKVQVAPPSLEEYLEL